MHRAVGAVVFVGVNLVVVLALLEGAVRAFTLIPDYVSIRYRAVAGDEVIAPVPHAAGASVLRAPEPTAEVWNLGVPATNTFNHAARFARLAPLLRPDATVARPSDLAGAGGPDPLVHFPAMADRLDALRATAETIGSRFVVALAPGHHPPADEYRRLESKLAAHAEGRGVPFLSLGNVLGNPARPELLLPNDSAHPNAAGHRLLAEALAPLVR